MADCSTIRGFGHGLEPRWIVGAAAQSTSELCTLSRMAASKPTSWLCRAATTLPTEPVVGTLAGGLGCFPLDNESSHPLSHAPRRCGIRRLVRVGKREALADQRDTSAAPHAGAAPKCISGRTSYLRVRLAFHRYLAHPGPFATDLGAALHRRVPPASAWPWVDHPVSGRSRTTHRPFGLAFATAPPV